MKSIKTYIFRVISAGLAAVVTLQIAILFPSQEAGKYFSFLGFVYILSTFFKMGQSYRYLNHKALKSDELLSPLLFLKESLVLTTIIAFLSYIVLKILSYLLSDLIKLPEYYIGFLCVSSYLLALIFNSAEYKKIIGDSFGYVLFSTFLISMFSILIFSILYLVEDNLNSVHAVIGLLISLSLTFFISTSITFRKIDIASRKVTLRKLFSTFNSNFKAGIIFMLYELSEHLQAWAVPIILTLLNEYSIIVEYRLAFRMLALISFVPLIVNSNFSRTFGELVNQEKHNELKMVLHSAIKKTAVGIVITTTLVYIAYPIIQHLFLSNKYMNILHILNILTLGFIFCALFESSSLILNLQRDKRMLPFFLNLFVFLMVLFSGLFHNHDNIIFHIFIIFSVTLSMKGFIPYIILKKKISGTSLNMNACKRSPNG